MVFFNFKFVLYFVLFGVFLVCTGNGYTIIFRHPFNPRRHVEGKKASWAGVFLVLLGLYALSLLLMPWVSKDLTSYLMRLFY